MESSLQRRQFQASRKQSFRTVHWAALIVLGMSVLPVCPALQEQKGESSAANPLYEPVRVLSGKTGYVNSLALSASGKFLAMACDDGKARLWNFASGEEIRALTGHRGAVYAVAISPNGRMLATGSLDETIKLWELPSGIEVHTLRGHDGWINAVAFTADGRELISAGRDSTVRIWDVSSGKNLRVIDDYPSEVFAVAVSPDGRWLASDKGNSFSIREIGTGREVADGAAEQWGINTLAFSRSDELMTNGYDGKLWVWGVSARKVENDVAIEGGPVISIAISGDGLLLAASCSGDKTVKVFNTRSWKEIRRLEGVSYPIGSVAFSADGSVLAAGGGDSPVRLWRRRN